MFAPEISIFSGYKLYQHDNLARIENFRNYNYFNGHEFELVLQGKTHVFIEMSHDLYQSLIKILIDQKLIDFQYSTITIEIDNTDSSFNITGVMISKSVLKSNTLTLSFNRKITDHFISIYFLDKNIFQTVVDFRQFAIKEETPTPDEMYNKHSDNYNRLNIQKSQKTEKRGKIGIASMTMSDLAQDQDGDNSESESPDDDLNELDDLDDFNSLKKDFIDSLRDSAKREEDLKLRVDELIQINSDMMIRSGPPGPQGTNTRAIRKAYPTYNSSSKSTKTVSDRLERLRQYHKLYENYFASNDTSSAQLQALREELGEQIGHLRRMYLDETPATSSESESNEEPNIESFTEYLHDLVNKLSQKYGKKTAEELLEMMLFTI